MMREGDTKSLATHKDFQDREQKSNKFCQALPEDRIIRIPQAEFLDLGTSNDCLVASDILPAFSAINVVGNFCQTLPMDEFVSVKPKFILETIANRGFKATCVLPPTAGIMPVCSRICRSKLIHDDEM